MTKFDGGLLVNKYTPTKLPDLITQDSCNLEVLRWVKKWNNSRNEFPEKKVLLLHGAPGVGKTTLAHLVAQISGYSVVEINASDERIGDSVINKISSAIQMKPLIESDKKPNLVIIDEIDAASSISNEKVTFEIIKKIKIIIFFSYS